MTRDPVEILRQRDAEVEKIRRYADLTEEAKNRRIAEVNERAQAEYARAREAEERERAERLEKAKQAVFRVPIPYGTTGTEEAQIHAAYRAAYNDVYYATIPYEDPAQGAQELERLLELAERTGDQLLAKAAYHRGIDMSAQKVVDTYLAARPKENKAWEAYTAAHEEASQSGDIMNLIGRGLTEQALSSEQSSGIGG